MKHLVRHLLVIFSGLASVLVLSNCGYNRKNENFSAAAATTSPTFTAVRTTILEPKCMNCHDHEPGAEEDLSNYAAVMKHVEAGRATSSELYETIESGEMPLARPMLTDDEILLVYKWIQNGAAND